MMSVCEGALMDYSGSLVNTEVRSMGGGRLLSACLDKGVDITSLLQSSVMKMSVDDLVFFLLFLSHKVNTMAIGD